MYATQEEKDLQEKNFFTAEDLQTNLQKQIPFVKKTAKDYHEFRLIEIVDEHDVKEIASFIYPYWRGQKQYLYFS